MSLPLRHHQLDGHEFEQSLGLGDGQGSLVCCSWWGRKESNTTEQLNCLNYPSGEHAAGKNVWKRNIQTEETYWKDNLNPTKLSKLSRTLLFCHLETGVLKKIQKSNVNGSHIWCDRLRRNDSSHFRVRRNFEDLLVQYLQYIRWIHWIQENTGWELPWQSSS